MKKIIALALCLALLLCAAAVQADETEVKTRLGSLKVGEEFTIQSKVPENYIFSLVTSTERNLVGILTGGAGQAWLSTLIITVLIIVFGETIPKITAKKNANRIALRNAYVVRGLMIVLFPLIWLVVLLVKLVTMGMK